MPKQAPDQQSLPRAAADLVAEPPRRVRADGDQRAVGEVEDAHQPVDERETRGDEEVHRAEAEPVIVKQDERAQCRASVDAEQPPDVLRVGEELRCRAGVDDAAAVEDDDVAREPLHDGEVLLDEHDRRQLGRALERLRHLGDEQRRETLRRLVDEQELVAVEERPRDRDHLLLPARERAGPLRGALAELRKELVDEVVPWVAASLREPEVLLDGQPGEDVPVLRHVADAAPHDGVRGQPRDVLAVQLDRAARPRDEPHQGAHRGRLADAVPAEHGRDAVGGDVERDPLQDVRLAEVDMEIADGERGALRRGRCRVGHRGSPR